jgi:hypothetical protein
VRDLLRGEHGERGALVAEPWRRDEPAAWQQASISVVFPAPPWPTTTTLRIRSRTAGDVEDRVAAAAGTADPERLVERLDVLEGGARVGVGEEHDLQHPHPVGDLGAHHGVVDVADHSVVGILTGHDHTSGGVDGPLAALRVVRAELHLPPLPLRIQRLLHRDLELHEAAPVRDRLHDGATEPGNHTDSGSLPPVHPAHRVQQVAPAAILLAHLTHPATAPHSSPDEEDLGSAVPVIRLDRESAYGRQYPGGLEGELIEDLTHLAGDLCQRVLFRPHTSGASGGKEEQRSWSGDASEERCNSRTAQGAPPLPCASLPLAAKPPPERTHLKRLRGSGKTWPQFRTGGA